MSANEHRPISPIQLVEHSLEVIETNQAPTGAYPAAPNHDTYQFSWLRDGAFISHAMDRYGRHDSSSAFHQWAASTIERHAHKVTSLEQLSREADGSAPDLLPDSCVLHTRFTLDGEEDGGDWGNFQLDGYGFWLTALAHHLKTTATDPDPYRKAVDLVARYLRLTWHMPCYDSWEEYPTGRHGVTQAAVAAGLRHAGVLLGDSGTSETASEVLQSLRQDGVLDDVLLKFVGGAPTIGDTSRQQREVAVAGHERVGRPLPDDALDGGSLLVLGSFGPFESDHSVRAATLAAVEEQLAVNGGVHRYLDDEYYGGGVWVLLSGALAQLRRESGDLAGAGTSLRWIEAQADASGNLPEQVAEKLLNPDHRDSWVRRWGAVGRPLLWSHAMYLLAMAVDDEDGDRA